MSIYYLYVPLYLSVFLAGLYHLSLIDVKFLLSPLRGGCLFTLQYLCVDFLKTRVFSVITPYSYPHQRLNFHAAII